MRAVMAIEGGLFSGRILGVTVAKGFQGVLMLGVCCKKARYSGVTAARKGGYHNGSRWGVSRRWKEVAPCGWKVELSHYVPAEIFIYIHKRRVLPMPSSVILEQPERERTVRLGSE
jgi:hypothetical protein